MQHQFIPKVPFTLYHATSTGTNLEILRSFATQGINPTIAKGYGQGEGFYMWTNKPKAIEHLRLLEEEGKIKGNKLLVRVQTTLNPQEWDLDAEDNASFILQFLYDHWDLFQSIPEYMIKFDDGKFLSPQLSEKYSSPDRIRFKKIKADGSNGGGFNKAILSDHFGLSHASLFGKIFTFIQKIHPIKCYEFECKIFDKHAHKPGIGVKYVGNDILPIDKMWARVDGKWEDALNLLVK